MFIQRAPTAIFACTSMETIFTSSAITNQTQMAFIYTTEK